MVRTFSYHSVSTIHGECSVVRLHSPFDRAAGIDDLGFGEKARRQFVSSVESPDGMIMVTGPPHHGKMTTLYAALQHLNDPSRKIVTLEDPVTNAVDEFTQVSIRFDLGQTYSSALHDLRHHDPDTILIEDISDSAAAFLAVQVAATGRKVLCSVDSPDSLSGLEQLRAQGVPSFLIGKALRRVLTQYKIRRICQQCRVETPPSEEDLDQVRREFGDEISLSGYTSTGCDTCGNSGFRGFTMVYEFLPITEDIREAVMNTVDSPVLRQLAYPNGRSRLIDAGLNRVDRGIITLDDFRTKILHR